MLGLEVCDEAEEARRAPMRSATYCVTWERISRPAEILNGQLPPKKEE